MKPNGDLNRHNFESYFKQSVTNFEHYHHIVNSPVEWRSFVSNRNTVFFEFSGTELPKGSNVKLIDQHYIKTIT